MDPLETVDAIATPVSEIGRAWMLDPTTTAHGHRLGLSPDIPFDFWVNGRGGVLGEGDAAKVIAGIAFMGPELARGFWEGRPRSLSAEAASLAYADAAANWARLTLASFEPRDLDELSDLADSICAVAPASVGVLFAGWRELERPSDHAGRAVVTLNVLRELRGGAHISAIHAAGLDPVRAIVSVDHPTHGGSGRAVRFGWPEPHPAPDFAARERAEALTSAIVAPIVERALDANARRRLVELVGSVRGSIGA